MKNSNAATFRKVGKKAFFARDFKTAFFYFERAALLGDAEAQCFLGGFYDDFDYCGFPVDFSKARELYEQSLAQGFARAGTLLGALYENGKGVPRDKAKAEKLFNVALACGDAYAAYWKAFLLVGKGRRSKDEISLEDARAAFDLVQRAETDAELVRLYGKISPCYKLVVSRVAGKLDDESLEREVFRALFRAQRKAVIPNLAFFVGAEDFADGAWLLGRAYLHGFCVSENEELAIRYFERAYALGIVHAAGEIAYIYRTREPADERAFKWAEEGAKRGDEYAMYELASCFRNGVGTQCDENLELEWLLKAADSGDFLGRDSIRSLLVTRYRARELLLATSDIGDADAAFRLACCKWNDSDGYSAAAVFCMTVGKRLMWGGKD